MRKMNWQIKKYYNEYFLQCEEYTFYLDTTNYYEAQLWQKIASLSSVEDLKNTYARVCYKPTICKRAV